MWGGDHSDVGTDVKVDDTGNIYASGFTASQNYPVTSGAFQTVNNSPPTFRTEDAFVTKLNSTGTGFVYSTYIGGQGNDEAFASYLDVTGNLYICGLTDSRNYPTTSGVFQQTPPPPPVPGAYPGFITKLNASGSALIYSTYLYGSTPSLSSTYNTITDIVVDSEGNAFVTGHTNSTNFPTTNGAYQRTLNGSNQDGFVSKLNSTATALLYSTYLGGSANDNINGIDIDSNGNIYVTGVTGSANYPTTSGSFQTTLRGEGDGFITKLNPTMSSLVYSTFLGGDGDDFGGGIKVTSAGEAFVIGDTNSSNFPLTDGALQTMLSGQDDVTITKLNSNGSSLVYSTYFGGSGNDGAWASGIDLTACGELYFTGTTNSLNLNVRRAYQSTNRTTLSDAVEGFVTKLSFLSTAGVAPDATADGSLPVAEVKEYKLPASVDTEVLDLQYRDANGDPQPLQVELRGSLYRPTNLTGNHPLLIFLHGMHETCVRNTNTPPSGAPTLPASDGSRGSTHLWYPLTGRCDNLDTNTFDENDYYNVIQNHQGYEYLGQKLASLGYVVVSINVNRGIHAAGNRTFIPGGYGDLGLILPRANMVLRHLQKLHEWNSCTTNPACQSLPNDRAGVDLRGKLDLSNVGLMGHSRGGQGVRVAYNLHKPSDSVWRSRIPNLNIKAVFEVGPTDFETASGIIAPPDPKYVVEGAKWSILLPMCDSDVIGLDGMKAYDRMLLNKNDNSGTQKSTYTVWGANHNFYNTKWTYNDNGSPTTCLKHDAIFNASATASLNQQQTGLSSVLAFFRANVGNSVNISYNQNFDPRYELPANIQSITRVERGYTPSPGANFTTVFEDFSGSNNSTNCSSGSNTCSVGGGSAVTTQFDQISGYHDTDLNTLLVRWNANGNDKSLQMNWRPSGNGNNISNHQTFDFRISRHPTFANVEGATNLSIQLVMANDTLSSPVKLCNYAYVDGPVGGYGDATLSYYNLNPKLRPLLQTVRIPLTAFTNANLTQIRGIKFTFNESEVGAVYLANLRFTK